MTFRDFNLNTPLLNALDDLGLVEPTSIQEKTFGPIMAGQDVLGIAQTGTGKTLAYLIPFIRQWQFAKKKVPTMLVLVPTKELVAQVIEEFEALAKYTNITITGAFGGTNIKTQQAAIAAGVDVVVGTPGRINDLILNGSISPKQIKKLVIDEVDQMLNLGFRASLLHLLELLTEKRQNMMFSATITDEVDQLIKSHFTRVTKIEDAASGTPVESIKQVAYAVPNFNTKLNFLEHLLTYDQSMTKVLVFAGGKRQADRIHSTLEFKFPNEVAVTHANKSSNTRLKTVEQFETGECRILIASDVIARGLDITEVSHVININIPEAPEDYVHRIGRTGRAESSGVALSMYAEREQPFLEAIEQLMKKSIERIEMPFDVEVSNILTPDEERTPGMKIIQVRKPKTETKGKAFHEKKEKNKKVPIKVTREDKMRAKYGKQYSSSHARRK
jgi:ATP-dependent RNA helicase RhlE